MDDFTELSIICYRDEQVSTDSVDSFCAQARLPLGIQHLYCFREHICLILSLPIIIKLLYHLRQRAILTFQWKKALFSTKATEMTLPGI